MPLLSFVPQLLPQPDQPVQHATDDEMRRIIYANDYVLAKFVDENCDTCRVLAPHIQRLANDSRFAHVLFVIVDADQTPVAAKEVSFSKAPFIVAYRKGTVSHCETVKTEVRVEEILLEFLMAPEIA